MGDAARKAEGATSVVATNDSAHSAGCENDTKRGAERAAPQGTGGETRLRAPPTVRPCLTLLLKKIDAVLTIFGPAVFVACCWSLFWSSAVATCQRYDIVLPQIRASEHDDGTPCRRQF